MRDPLIQFRTPLMPDEFLFQLGEYFDPSGVMKDLIKVTDRSIRLKLDGKIYEWVYEPRAPRPKSAKPRIVIDPGHIGGESCDMRWIKINGHGELQEGNLTLVTGLLVKRLLEEWGAEVILTRSALQPITEKDPRDFEGEAKRLTKGGSLNLPPFLKSQFASDIEYATSYLWNKDDLEKRAALINGIDKDLALSIHYFGSLKSEFTSANGVCAFVKGNYLPEELESDEQKVGCMKQIAEGNMHEHLALGMLALSKMERFLEIGAASEEFAPNSMKIEEGLFCRNLFLTRNVSGLFVYLEGPFQNNPAEFQRLIAREDRIGDFYYSHRILEYATAISESVKEYWNAK